MTLERDYEVLEAATPGEWVLDDDNDFLLGVWTGGSYICRRAGYLPPPDSDMRFVAHFSPARVRELLDRLRSAEEALNDILNEPSIMDISEAEARARQHLDHYKA